MITEFAPAKVNLSLRVGALGEDGYHPVDSIVVFADWGDALTVTPSDALSLEVSGPMSQAIPGGEDNLVLRAVRLLAQASGQDAKGNISLVKEIPAGAGLGGGSADAAAALRAFNRLWELDWPLDMLAGLGSQIGSDIAACVWSQPLRMTGRGERIRLIDDWPDFPALLVNPGVSVATGPVFAKFDEAPQTGAAFRPQGDLIGALQVATNDLTAPACAIAPVIDDVLAALAATKDPQLVRMSGSGATCFAIYPDEAARDAAAGAIRQVQPGWHVFPIVFRGVSAITPT
ncbi:4-(cytidine 5'-diphospho)-2-C-methyl-D-erythritol kinase [Hyphobacterium sp. HN65]|uniref:4-diphosphocytidyl-2-C-methyl-D-erythritol kinase n=1 Tax=Hyphobacterium lacteum TaxID=3116575 RepID=A0ABU7LMX3_9PROT|nr:4-(cytidine 5'-diphospho)-2-C-methyl-D-erythritol kinase [Hyphobacterium sp. HN65]MEE2525270.1 4-(cytidine 5'-diphospho)-2-C-methyl-D-erythritol kinase [Hyphobacterium sp. HN65]